MVSGANGLTGLSAFYLLTNRGLEKGTETEPVLNQNMEDLDVLEKALKWKSASSLRLLSALRCLGGNIRSGFGGLGRGMSSALVGGGYGWDGWVVCFCGWCV